MYKKIDRCRICNNDELVEVLDLGVQALTGVFPKSREQPITAGPLKLVKCVEGPATCGLLQLQHSYDLGEMYGDNYGYRSGLNPSMVAHLRAKVARILGLVKLQPGALIIDIGSNDSTTLQAYPRGDYTLVGIDPTGVKFHSYYPPHIGLIPEFFSAQTVRRKFGDRKAAIITSFSMFYDLEAPLTFVQEVRDVLADEGIWVFEQSYMPTMLDRNSYDTACHEHLEYYSLKQIKWMADKAGLKIIDVEFNDVNGGSFSVVAAKQGSSHAVSPQVEVILRQEVQRGLGGLQPYMEFAARVAKNKQALQEFVATAKQSGKRVAALGASTKGNVVLQYCGFTAADIESVGEVNPDKFGAFTPGSLIPIVSEDNLLASGPDYLIVLTWHFRQYFVESKQRPGSRLVFPLPVIEVV